MRFTRGFQQHPAGSVLVEFGGTKVICAASVTGGVPRWRKGSGLGWLTAEYAMLPSATHERSDRESVKGRVGGRTHEISRLIGRSLRACVDLRGARREHHRRRLRRHRRPTAAPAPPPSPAPTSRWRTPSPTCGERGMLTDPQPLSCQIAAVSVGVVGGRVRLDLPYEEDARAEVDMNVVATDVGTLVEVQGTAEGATFPRRTLDAMIDCALVGIETLTALQRAALAEPLPAASAAATHRRDAASGSATS